MFDLQDSVPDDVRAVLDAAALLDVTEFDVFRLGYWRWYGRGARSAELERWFAAYMFADRVPAWARHFARLVVERAEAGRLDPQDLGVDRLERSPRMVARGVRYAVALGTGMIALLLLAESAARLLDLGARCMFPPCY